jgi:hypothetical protein
METINRNNLIPLLKESILVEQFDEEVVVPKEYVFTNFMTIVQYKIIINDEMISKK